EEAADACRAPADEHLDEARTRSGVEVTAGVRGDGARQHRLAGPGRSVEQNSAGGARAEYLEALGVLEPLRNVDELLLGRVDALHVVPQNLGGLTRLDALRPRRAHRVAEQEDEDEEDAPGECHPEDWVPLEEEVVYGCDQGHRWRHSFYRQRTACAGSPILGLESPLFNRCRPRFRPARRASPCWGRPDPP